MPHRAAIKGELVGTWCRCRFSHLSQRMPASWPERPSTPETDFLHAIVCRVHNRRSGLRRKVVRVPQEWRQEGWHRVGLGQRNCSQQMCVGMWTHSMPTSILVAQGTEGGSTTDLHVFGETPGQDRSMVKLKTVSNTISTTRRPSRRTRNAGDSHEGWKNTGNPAQGVAAAKIDKMRSACRLRSDVPGQIRQRIHAASLVHRTPSLQADIPLLAT